MTLNRIFIIMALILSPIAASANDALIKSDRYRLYSKPHEMKVTITVSDSPEETVFSVISANQDSLAIQKLPERSANRKLLMKDENLWLYTPGVKKAIRIGIDQRLAGDVANGDILRTRFQEDYKATVLDSPKTEIKMRLDRNSKSAAYHRIIYTIKSDTHRPFKAEFYAPSGKMLKIAEFTEFKKISGEILCTKVKITDVQTKRVSTITYSNFKARSLSPDYFNKDAVVDL